MIEPVSRVEGRQVTCCSTSTVAFNKPACTLLNSGLRTLHSGPPLLGVPTLVQRLCGICPVSHLLAASKGLRPLCHRLGAFPPRRKSCADCYMPHRCCNRMPCTSSIWPRPTCSLAFDDAVAHRNIVGVLQTNANWKHGGIRIRKFGQGGHSHPLTSPEASTRHRLCARWDFNRPLSVADRDALLHEVPPIIDWSAAALNLARRPVPGQPRRPQHVC